MNKKDISDHIAECLKKFHLPRETVYFRFKKQLIFIIVNNEEVMDVNMSQQLLRDLQNTRQHSVTYQLEKKPSNW